MSSEPPPGEVSRAAVPSIAAPYRFQWEEAQHSHVLLYPEGMIKLNQAAGEILAQCDGARTVGEIITALEHKFEGADLADDVLEFLADARGKRWISI